MTLIKSVSGIRGTIGGNPGTNLTPPDLVKFISSFVELLKQKYQKDRLKIILGRDSRISGPMVASIVSGTLSACGADIIDIGQATTPTTEVAVVKLQADGGIILTASHNPKQWNALKLLNNEGEFLSAQDGDRLLELTSEANTERQYADVENIGAMTKNETILKTHIKGILAHTLVKPELIREKNYKIVVDGINSVGAFAVPQILKSLGVNDDNIILLNGEPNGEFAHNPEPIPQNLTGIVNAVKEHKADLGIVVDPDVDRLAFVTEQGELFGEEYTLVAVADYILSHTKGNTVSNLSSSRALRDITEKHGGQYSASAVGEVNVVAEMKRTNAVIGGEGNGGVIYPEMHYGRDALAGIALFLSHMAISNKSCSRLRAQYPNYEIIKSKISLDEGIDVDEILNKIKAHFSHNPEVKINTVDGVKIDFSDSWVHLRKSNTEPIIRIYAEAKTAQQANDLASKVNQLAIG
ncbi:MAG: phosphoglucosamine mutase [Bacteroidota bacterium]|nr:phosphoglucosamine mutase [Bacteroidota bacterium]